MEEEHLFRLFGFREFLPGQRPVIERLLAGGSAAAIFPTGAGKSLCYQLPALLLPGMTLVVSPLLALMKDQLDFLKKRGLPAARLDSTMDRAEFRSVVADAQAGRLKILLISVERFANERFRNQLSRMPVTLLAVDEAHCISAWGHNFRPEYLKLPMHREEFGIRQVLLLTATATPEVLADMCAQFGVDETAAFRTGSYRKNLFLQVTPAGPRQRRVLLAARVAEAPRTPTVVYVTLQKTAESVAGFLSDRGIRAEPYHAGLGNDRRREIQDRFMAGDLHAVAATIAFGMGVDKADIGRIIHFDLPKSLENYSQEIGRAGRDGRPALCEVLAGTHGLRTLENFVYGDTPEIAGIREVLEEVKNAQGEVYEVRMTRLSNRTDIRLLALKTLFAYLEMRGILRSMLSHFSEYRFKFLLAPEDILEKFEGERKTFLKKVFDHTETLRTWSVPDFGPFMGQNGPFPGRNGPSVDRVVRALEYLDEKGWIELNASGTVHGFSELERGFETDSLARELHGLFLEKERAEIGRIAQVLAFLESAECLSRVLARRFGEELPGPCGHCSVCCQGPARLAPAEPPPPVPDRSIKDWISGLGDFLNRQPSPVSAARFLCGIPSPRLARAKDLAGFGAMERHPFPEVARRARALTGLAAE